MKVTTDACLFGSWIDLKQEKNPRLLDIGTGTGLVSLLVAQNHPETFIEAIEIDESAYQQAKENFKQSPWADRLHAIQGDVKTFAPTNKYDIIISNPPFYEKEIRSNQKEKNLAHHNEGLLLSELFQFIHSHLKPEGEFFLLLPFKRNEEIKKLFLHHSLQVLEMVFVRQTVNHAYFRIMIKGSLKPGLEIETRIGELAIKNGAGEYTSDFINLLRDFYLYL